ncbi:MAG: TadE/TadG family type IV pilus assembly protein [Actinomycetota bacterium]
MLGIFKRGKDEGANLVEFALLAPLLILLLFGIIEFGWLFSQNNDVKHGAREGARAAAVNMGDFGTLVDVVCDSMDLASDVNVEFTRPGGDIGEDGEIGDTATVAVEASPSSLSGLMDAFLPATLESMIEFRLEQPATWDDGSQSC